MLLCPFVWIMLFFFVQIVTVDESLRQHGTKYNASVENVERSYVYTKQGPEEHTELKLLYKVNGTNYFITENFGPDGGTYEKGDIVPVTALPSNPSVTEPFLKTPGTKQLQDLMAACFCFFINLALELAIWLRPMNQKYFAERGIPTDALITSLGRTTRASAPGTLGAEISYNVNGIHHHTSVTLSWGEYQQLQRGTSETILCDPQDANRVVFYKFCMYKTTLP
jgi:hypothetical protein